MLLSRYKMIFLRNIKSYCRYHSSIICKSSINSSANASSVNSVIKDCRGIGLMGILEDRNGSFMSGPRDAPQYIRKYLHCDSSNSYTEYGVDISSSITDVGDVESEDPSATALLNKIKPVYNKMILKDKLLPITLGGDHSVSGPIVMAISEIVKSPLYIVHFDAHPDIYENFQDNNSSHASQMARILEVPGLCAKLISIGIRTLTPHQRKQYEKYNVTTVEAKDFPAHGSELRGLFRQHMPNPAIPVYISFDIDVIDPGMAPGVSHIEPGGLSVRQCIDSIHSIPGMIIGADVVEYNPSRDTDYHITARVACKITKEIAGKIMMSTGKESHISE